MGKVSKLSSPSLIGDPYLLILNGSRIKCAMTVFDSQAR